MQELNYTIPEFCARAKISRTQFYAELRAGRIAAKKAGRRTLIPVAVCQAWVDSLPNVAVRAAA